MLLVFGLSCLIFGVGAILKVPSTTRWALIIILFTASVVALLVLPADSALTTLLGGSAAPYLLLAGFCALFAVYRWGLTKLRAKASSSVKPIEEPKKLAFSATELDRYARHIILREIGGPGQKKLKQAKVLVIGAGGLGAPVLQYLAASGVGTIGVIDDDLVENANLQRQVIHRDEDIGTPKVFSAQNAMLAQNPHISVRPYHRRLTQEIADELFDEYDLILDGTDNFETRYLANAAAVEKRKPLISGALSQWEGQLSIFDPANGAPCYQCIFPSAPADGLAPSCAEAGVIGPLPGVVGAMMAQEAIKLITGAGAVLRGEMLIYDGLYGETRKMTLKPRADCPICAK
ncbi:HesA/MoeB/ThiF family protein [Planktotalea sp.]|uniref:HesA/MoeB/ThiF family protein n=1 Tax=Planktotalea sp. TaxID=2029877 RepID=UPI003D6ABD5E